MNLTHRLSVVLGLGIILTTAGNTWAQDQELSGFSMTRLKKVQMASAGKGDHGNCMSFDADFSAPLQDKPKAILDFVESHLIEGVISFVLDVVQISPNRYQLNMKTDPEACKALKSKTENVQLTIESGLGSDGRPVLPDEHSFRLKSGN